MPPTDDYAFDTGGCEIQLNGNAIDSVWKSALVRAEVHDALNRPAMFLLSFSSEPKDKGDWPGLELSQFNLGDTIKVAMGLDNVKPLMEGEITTIAPQFEDFNVLELRGYDLMHRMRFGTHTRTFLEQKESEIASTMAGEASLSDSVDETTTQYDYLLQYNQSNYDFLLSRLPQLNYEMLVDEKSFLFRKCQEGQAEVATLIYKQQFDTLSLEMSSLQMGSEVTATSWDPEEKKTITATNKSLTSQAKMGGKANGFELSSPDSPFQVLDWDLPDLSTAENVATAQNQMALQAFIVGEGEGSGSPLLRAGSNVKLQGLGSRFSGLYYITSSKHIFDAESGYRTSFTVRRTGI